MSHIARRASPIALVTALVALSAGCRPDSVPSAPKSDAISIAANTYLVPGVAIPIGQVVVGVPEPYSVAKFGALTAAPTPENRAPDPQWQSPAAMKEKPPSTTGLPTDPPAPCANCWHEGKGWYVNSGRGIYAKVDVQRNFTVKTGDVNVSVYAPTHYPAGGACLEATVMHYRTTGNPSGPTSNFFGFWDWCERTDNGGWGYAADMDASGWRSNYVRNMTHADGVGVEEGAYFQIYANNPAGTPGSYDCWNGLLWNFNTGGWSLVITRCGPDPVHTYYPGTTGWSMWEDYNVTFYGCADYDHPGISAEQIQYYTSLGTWSSVADPGVKTPLQFGLPNYCWPIGTYFFHEHLANMWHGHTYADRQ